MLLQPCSPGLRLLRQGAAPGHALSKHPTGTHLLCNSLRLYSIILRVQPLLFPRREAFPNPYWVDAADGSKLACSYHGVVNPAAITVVYFHGNGEIVADYLPAFQTG